MRVSANGATGLTGFSIARELVDAGDHAFGPAAPEPLAQRIRWLLTALDACEHGLAADAAMRKADADVDVAAGARDELAAFLCWIGADCSLVARLRQHVLAQAAGPLQTILRRLGRALRYLRPERPLN